MEEGRIGWRGEDVETDLYGLEIAAFGGEQIPKCFIPRAKVGILRNMAGMAQKFFSKKSGGLLNFSLSRSL